jgi:hypothetical protein
MSSQQVPGFASAYLAATQRCGIPAGQCLSPSKVLVKAQHPLTTFSFLSFQAVYLTDEHQPDRTTSETPFFCYTHLLMKINVGPVVSGPVPVLGAPRTAGTDQQDAQLPPAYFDVSLALLLAGSEVCPDCVSSDVTSVAFKPLL